jgi:hypothetical protein
VTAAGFPRAVPALIGTALTAVLLAATLSGCAGTPPDLDRGAAGRLQSQVLAVTQAAAAEDAAGGLQKLAELTSALDAAAADGKVSFKRHQSIKTAIDGVREDLAAKLAQQQAAAQEAAKAAADAAAAQKAAEAEAAAAQAAQEAADRAAVAPAPVPAPAPATPGQNGKAKGKGKGGG